MSFYEARMRDDIAVDKDKVLVRSVPDGVIECFVLSPALIFLRDMDDVERRFVGRDKFLHLFGYTVFGDDNFIGQTSLYGKCAQNDSQSFGIFIYGDDNCRFWRFFTLHSLPLSKFGDYFTLN